MIFSNLIVAFNTCSTDNNSATFLQGIVFPENVNEATHLGNVAAKCSSLVYDLTTDSNSAIQAHNIESRLHPIKNGPFTFLFVMFLKCYSAVVFHVLELDFDIIL